MKVLRAEAVHRPCRIIDGIVSIDDRLRDALERALVEARASLEPELRTLTHELTDATTAAIASAAEAFDRAPSLAGVLHALVDAAAQHADRVGLFLVRDGRLRAWELRGLDETALASARADHTTTFPLAVGGRIVAILYAESAPPRAGGVGFLDLLTRYAGRQLESMTLHTALGIGR